MITLKTGNILSATTEAIVNPVNCVGVMGKGLALEFKKKYPANFSLYRSICLNFPHKVNPGKMLVCDLGPLTLPKYIINFPTKIHWRDLSRLEYIESGLLALKQEILSRDITSISIPALGCGNGGLAWFDVYPCIYRLMGPLESIKIDIYPPTYR